MAHIVVSEAMLTIACVIAVCVLSYALLSSVSSFQHYQILQNRALSERSATMIEVFFAVNISSTNVKVWVKNIGGNEIRKALIEKLDVIFGPRGNFRRVPYNAAGPPTWTYQIVNDVDGDGNWDFGETIEITIVWDKTLEAGDYYVKVVTYNGISDHYWFSVGGG